MVGEVQVLGNMADAAVHLFGIFLAYGHDNATDGVLGDVEVLQPGGPCCHGDGELGQRLGFFDVIFTDKEADLAHGEDALVVLLEQGAPGWGFLMKPAKVGQRTHEVSLVVVFFELGQLGFEVYGFLVKGCVL